MRQRFLALVEAAALAGALAAPAAAQDTRTGLAAFGIEALGGTAGSLAGFGVGYALAERCDSEDLVCNLENAGAAVLAGTVFSALGAWGAGSVAETRPSLGGASLGAIAGAAAGIGVWHLLTEELDLVTSDTGGVLSYAITQGLFTALGSRLLRALRE